jgi:prevent-host-death family protein
MVTSSYNRGMRTVKISDLKARLSAHLRLVRQGEEVVVCDRREPVARIVPVSLEDRSAQERRLMANGVLTPPLKMAPHSWPEPPGNVSDEVMQQIWREEREHR